MDSIAPLRPLARLRRRALLALPLAAAIPSVRAAGDAAAPLRGAGATFPAPLYQRWAEAYRANRGTPVQYEAVGSGQGIARVERGEVDFGATDAPLSREALARAGLLQFPVVIGGVVPVINVAGIAPGRLRLDAGVLSGIYRGRIKRWNDAAIAALNPGLALPEANITAVHRADASGTTFLWSRWLAARDADWRAAPGSGTTLAWPTGVNDAAGIGNEEVASLVQRTRWSIGYVEYAYARRHRLADAMLPTGDGAFVRATHANFEAAIAGARWRDAIDLEQSFADHPVPHGWPIVGASFVLVPREGTRTGDVLRFFRWALAEGGDAATDLDYVALPAAAVRLVEDMLRRP
jgi:phosphate transport system substrate-binding protein